jgi:glutaredoxin
MLTLFTSSLCGMCAVMKGWLDDLKVAYRAVDIDLVPEARRVLRGIARGQLAVPTIILENGRVLVEPRRDQLLDALRKRAD